MKILMVTMSMNIGGAETHILELCRELHSAGHDVTLASFGGVYADMLTDCGVRHVELPLHTKSPASVVKSYRGLEKLIRGGGFDIVHAHARIPAFICGLLCDKLKFRFVTTAHLNFSLNHLWRRISRWGSRVMAVSDDIADYLVTEYGYPREKIHLTINGIDTGKFSPDIPFAHLLRSHNLPDTPNRRRIVYVSRLDADRADPAYKLVAIAPKIAENFPDTDIIIVGSGTELDSITHLAGEVNKNAGRNLVTITGAVVNINEYAAAATVFVGVSRSVLEAMSASRPVIVAGGQGALGIFDEACVKPAVDTNFCCRGFALADEQTLYSWIEALLQKSPAQLSQMGSFNRDFVLKNYTTRRMAEDYLAMYRDALDAPIPFTGSPDVVISGYYGFGNMGDESLLDVIASSLAQEIPNVKIAALTRKPKIDSKRTGLCCVSRFNLPAVYRIISRSKLLISGGGSLLQDMTSKRSLKYYAGVLAIAEACGVNSYVYANGIGPIRNKSNRKLTARVVSRATEVSVRDPDSAEELRKIGVVRDKINVTADPAFLIKPYDERRLYRVVERIGIKDGFFAVSLRSYVQPPEISDPIRVADEIASACAQITNRYGLTPVIIPMQLAQDADVCRRFAETYAKLMSNAKTAILYHPENAPELIAVLSKSAFVIGMRLHAVIFASSAAVPVIALAYDPKVTSLMKTLAQPYSIPLENTANISELTVNSAAQILKNPEEIKTTLRTVAESMRALCQTDLTTAHTLLK